MSIMQNPAAHQRRRHVDQGAVPIQPAGHGHEGTFSLGADSDGQIVETAARISGRDSDLQIASPQVNVDIDRDKAAALGVTAQQIENALYDAYGERQASTIYADVAEYWVVFEVLPQFQLDPDALARLYITSSMTSSNGTPNLVPLSAVANLTRSIGPTSISHVGQLPAVTISFNLAPGVSLEHRRRTSSKS